MKHYYDIAKGVILRKDFELNDMLDQLRSLRMSGQLNDDQLTELMQLARENADPARSAHLMERVEALEICVRNLMADGTDPAPGPAEDWPAWQMHHAYRSGDRVTFEGKRYTCVLPEHTASTTWSPKDYPGYWQAEA